MEDGRECGAGCSQNMGNTWRAGIAAAGPLDTARAPGREKDAAVRPKMAGGCGQRPNRNNVLPPGVLAVSRGAGSTPSTWLLCRNNHMPRYKSDPHWLSNIAAAGPLDTAARQRRRFSDYRKIRRGLDIKELRMDFTIMSTFSDNRRGPGSLNLRGQFGGTRDDGPSSGNDFAVGVTICCVLPE